MYTYIYRERYVCMYVYPRLSGARDRYIVGFGFGIQTCTIETYNIRNIRVVLSIITL